MCSFHPNALGWTPFAKGEHSFGKFVPPLEKNELTMQELPP
jgi:hypothetical protein